MVKPPIVLRPGMWRSIHWPAVKRKRLSSASSTTRLVEGDSERTARTTAAQSGGPAAGLWTERVRAMRMDWVEPVYRLAAHHRPEVMRADWYGWL
eukprot:3294933-Prymnesium_polylepis.1